MTYEEKGVWVYIVVVLGTYGTYTGIVLSQLAGTPITEIDYAAPLLWSIGASIVAAIILRIVVEIVSPSDKQRADSRDKEINRRGELIGMGGLVAGALGGMLLALVQAEHFWIANAIYLGFVLSAIIGSVAKIVLYRRGF
jgi:MFS family permease